MSAAYARVELRDSASHRAAGYPDFKKGQVRYLTKPSDIAYFKGQSSFKVTDLEPPAAEPDAPSKKGKGKAKPAAPSSAKPEGDGEDEGEDGPKFPQWKPSMNKTDLTAAAEARGIAVTDGEKKADLIDLLRMFDEDSSEDEDEDDAEDDEDEGDGETEDKDEG